MENVVKSVKIKAKQKGPHDNQKRTSLWCNRRTWELCFWLLKTFFAANNPLVCVSGKAHSTTTHEAILTIKNYWIQSSPNFPTQTIAALAGRINLFDFNAVLSELRWYTDADAGRNRLDPSLFSAETSVAIIVYPLETLCIYQVLKMCVHHVRKIRGSVLYIYIFIILHNTHLSIRLEVYQYIACHCTWNGFE